MSLIPEVKEIPHSPRVIFKLENRQFAKIKTKTPPVRTPACGKKEREKSLDSFTIKDNFIDSQE